MKRIIVYIYLIFVLQLACNAGNRYAVADGNWNTTSTWSTTSGGASGAAVPIAGDNVYINNNHTVTVNINTASVTLLSISSGSTLSVSANYTVSSTTITVDGTYINNSTGAITGTVTINGTYKHNANCNLTTFTWNSTATLSIGSGCGASCYLAQTPITIAAYTQDGGTFNLGGSTSRIINIGTFTQTGGTITSGISCSLNVTNSGSQNSSGVIGGLLSLTKTGTGTLSLAGTNTYTGITTISAGRIEPFTLANGGSNSSIGASSNSAGNLIIDGGTLRYTGSANTSTDRLFTLTANGGCVFSSSSGSGTVTFSNTGTIIMSGTTSRTLEFGGGASAINSFAPILSDPSGGGVTSINKTGSTSTWILSGINTYSGTTTIASGILKLGSTSALGTTVMGTYINPGATLDLNGQNYTTAEGLTCNPLYSFYKNIIIDETKLPGTTSFIDFPILISLTDADLKSSANGGDVQNSNGYDIIFTTSDGSVQLNHQIEKYTATTGEYIAWVKIPNLSTTANTTIRMYYKNQYVTANPSTTATWSSDYMSVYHFENSVNDASSNGKNCTNVSTTDVSAKIGNGRDLDNSTDIISSNASGKYLQLPNSILNGITNFTYSGWVYLDRHETEYERIFDFGINNTTSYFFLCPSSYKDIPNSTLAKITIAGNGAEQGMTVNNATTNVGSWIYWSVVLDDAGNTLSLYRNGSLYGSASGVTLTPNDLGSTTTNYFGRSQWGGDHYIDAKFDEFRLLSTNRSADWITAEYNNQNNPSTFYSVGAETTNGSTSYVTIINSSVSNATYAGLLTLGCDAIITGGSGNINITNSGTISGSGLNITLGGAIGGTLTSIIGIGAGTITKQDAGTWILSGVNTYTGITTINGGTLKAANSTALGTAASGVSISSGGIFDINGYNLGTKAFTLNGGTLINNGGACTQAIQKLTVTANSYIGGNGRWDVRNNGLSDAGVTINNGITLTKQDANEIFFVNVPVVNNGSLVINAGNQLLENGSATSGTGTYTINATGALGLIAWGSGVNLTNNVIVNSGTIFSNNNTGGNSLISGVVSITGTVTINSSVDFSVSGIISGTGAITKSGVGTLTLSGSNTYTGTTTITAGKLKLGASGVIPNASAVTINGTLDMNTFSETVGSISGSGTIDNISGAGTPTLTCGGDNATTTYSGTIQNTTGILSITKAGSGTLTLSGGNNLTYDGATSVSVGTLILVDCGALATGSSPASFDISSGAVLEFNANSNTLSLGSTAALGTVITGTGTLRKTGGWPLGLGNQGSTSHKVYINMTGGLIDIQAGTIFNGGWQGGYWSGNKASLNIESGATLDLWDGNAVYVDALTGAGTVVKGLGSIQTIIVGVNNGSGIFTGNITETSGSPIAFTKQGTGIQTLSGTNTYTGLTTISGGILKLGSSTALGTIASGTTINNGAALDLNGQTYANNESLTINGTGVSTGGAILNSSLTPTVFSGPITLSSASTIMANNQITLSGTISPSSQNLTIAGTNSIIFTSNTISVNNLGISSGTVIAGSSTINVYGSFTNSGTFTPNTSTVNLLGSSLQVIPAVSFNNVIINNLADASLGGNITVNGALTLTSGILNTGAYIINLGSTGNIIEATPSITAPTSYVIGNVKATRSLMQNVNNTFGGIGVEILETAKTNNSTEVFRVTGTACTGDGNTGITRYFTINPTDDSGLNGTMIFHYFDNEITGHVEGNLDIYKSIDGRITWSRHAPVRNLANNTLTLSNITSFSDWTASDGVNESLPIELIDFEVFASESNVEFNWSTASEINNDYFTIEESYDGVNWVEVSKINGAGNSSSIKEYSYNYDKSIDDIIYYRLKQTDYNGTTSYSKIVIIQGDYQNDTTLHIFYNKQKQILELDFSSNLQKSTSYIEVLNIAGQVVYKSYVFELQINVSGFPKGIYYVFYKQDNKENAKRVIID